MKPVTQPLSSSKLSVILTGTEVKLNLFTMLGKEEITVEKTTGLVIKRIDKRVEIELPKTYSRARIPFRRNQIPRPEVANEWPHLTKIADKIHPYQDDVDVGILIGCNCPRAIKPREVILGKGDDPYAVRTLLGWCIIGPVIPHQNAQEDGDESDVATCNRIMSHEIGSDIPTNLNFIPKIQTKEEINPFAVKKMFEADFSERHSITQDFSQEDRKFLATAKDGIHHREDGHYEMPLPLKEPSPNLPNNREVALRRLNQLKRRFDSNKKYKEDYTTFMESMIQNGYAEKVPSKNCLPKVATESCQPSPSDVSEGQESSYTTDGKIWYIPHHGVYHPKKPDKIRVVFDCSFVLGKARVTPLKPVTVPRLELTAAVVSVKSSVQLQQELDLEELEDVYWTDSQVVLGYIANETRRFHVFVANRVQQIQEHSSPNQWHYVDTKLNPADHASRGLSAKALLNSSWITGPAFLWKEESYWHEPSSNENHGTLQLSDDDPEVKKNISLATNLEEPFTNLLGRLEYFSDFYRAKRAIALCLHYVQKLKRRISHEVPSNTPKS